MRRENGQPAERAHQSGPTGLETAGSAAAGYEPPRYEVICLACEVSAYAPDGDIPLF
jgi:hypothetical protein